MGWITRRIVGFAVSAVVASLLWAFAVTRGWVSGEPNLTTACGVLVIGIAFLVSLSVTTRMKRRDEYERAHEQYVKAWQEYYARMAYYPQQQRAAPQRQVEKTQER